MAGKILFLFFGFFLISCDMSLLNPNPREHFRIVDQEGKGSFYARKVPVLNQEELRKQGKPEFIGDESLFTKNSPSAQRQVNVPDTQLPRDLFADKPSPDQNPYITGATQNNNIQGNYIEPLPAPTDNTINLNTFDQKTKEDEERIKRLKEAQEERIRQERITEGKEKVVEAPKTTPQKTFVIKDTDNEANNEGKIIENDYNTPIKKGYYIQIGTFSTTENANKALNTYSKIEKGIIKETTNKNTKTLYRVLLGPIKTEREAEKKLEKIIETGHYDVFITKQ